MEEDHRQLRIGRRHAREEHHCGTAKIKGGEKYNETNKGTLFRKSNSIYFNFHVTRKTDNYIICIRERLLSLSIIYENIKKYKDFFKYEKNFVYLF